MDKSIFMKFWLKIRKEMVHTLMKSMPLQLTIASAPQSFTAINGSAQVLLNWTSPASNGRSAITGYDIYRGTVSGAETLLTTVGNISSYLDTLGLSNGITYYYLICAINSVGLGTNFSRISTIPFTIPGIPLISDCKSWKQSSILKLDCSRI